MSRIKLKESDERYFTAFEETDNNVIPIPAVYTVFMCNKCKNDVVPEKSEMDRFTGDVLYELHCPICNISEGMAF